MSKQAKNMNINLKDTVVNSHFVFSVGNFAYPIHIQ